MRKRGKKILGTYKINEDSFLCMIVFYEVHDVVLKGIGENAVWVNIYYWILE